MFDHSQLREPLQSVLDQGARMVETLSSDHYVRVPEPLSTAGVGAHLRHCLDFVKALLGGLDTGRINYDGRERDPAIETDPRAALELIHELRAQLVALEGPAFDSERELLVRQDAPEGKAGDGAWCRSSVGREFVLVMSHTVHHYALIAMTLRSFGIDPGPGFGVAPSTLAYWKEQGRCAPLAG